ncbi:MAG: hydrogenase maturation nickel metallochaperone HypA [Chloroflexota bacterium]
MHELAITEDLLSLAIRHGLAAGATRVTDLYLVIGELSTVVGESVQFYWDVVSRGTICEGACLHFERVPAELTCSECGERYRIPQEVVPCPRCGSAQVRVSAGDDFRLESLGIEV